MKNFVKECADVILLNTTTLTFVSLADYRGNNLK